MDIPEWFLKSVKVRSVTFEYLYTSISDRLRFPWTVQEPIVDVPFLWFFLNMMWLFLVGFCLLKLMRFLGSRADGALTYRAKVNLRIDVEAMAKFLKTRTIEVSISYIPSNADPAQPVLHDCV